MTNIMGKSLDLKKQVLSFDVLVARVLVPVPWAGGLWCYIARSIGIRWHSTYLLNHLLKTGLNILCLYHHTGMASDACTPNMCSCQVPGL
jgi:hypothetical protein